MSIKIVDNTEYLTDSNSDLVLRIFERDDVENIIDLLGYAIYSILCYEKDDPISPERLSKIFRLSVLRMVQIHNSSFILFPKLKKRLPKLNRKLTKHDIHYLISELHTYPLKDGDAYKQAVLAVRMFSKQYY